MTADKNPLESYASGRYRPPRPDELREIAEKHSLTGARAAALIGIDGRTWRRYVGGEREIPYSNWRLLLYDLDELKNQNNA